MSTAMIITFLLFLDGFLDLRLEEGRERAVFFLAAFGLEGGGGDSWTGFGLGVLSPFSTGAVFASDSGGVGSTGFSIGFSFIGVATGDLGIVGGGSV
ncbi:MAG: hypothetical protein U9R15_05625, partial [Chloroflexota bacterium]|nr:hypothetical protein [Chloroflexota bacterium]